MKYVIVISDDYSTFEVYRQNKPYLSGDILWYSLKVATFYRLEEASKYVEALKEGT